MSAEWAEAEERARRLAEDLARERASVERVLAAIDDLEAEVGALRDAVVRAGRDGEASSEGRALAWNA